MQISLIRTALASVFILLKILGTKGHMTGSYYHDDKDLPANKKWMSKLSNTTGILSVSIPGTHDSCSLFGGDILKTQSLSIMQQLNAGIRFLDIRIADVFGSLGVFHDKFYQNIEFDTVLGQVTNFLVENPSEIVLMRVRQELESKVEGQFEKLFLNSIGKFAHVIWTPTEMWNPTIGMLRGKIVIMQNFITSDGKFYGINYDLLNKQDMFKLSTNWDLYDKWTAVKNHLIMASMASGNNGFLNYLSGASGTLPYFVASGHVTSSTDGNRLIAGFTTSSNKYEDFPRINCLFNLCTILFEGTNVLTENYLNKSKPKYVGIIAADFPGSSLIKSVIDCNFI